MYSSIFTTCHNTEIDSQVPGKVFMIGTGPYEIGQFKWSLFPDDVGQFKWSLADEISEFQV
jgi:hypothetical protein